MITDIDGYLTFDTSGSILEVSPPAAAMLGYEPADLRGRFITTLIEEDFAISNPGRLARLLRDDTDDFEVPLVRGDGSRMWAAFRGRLGSDGAVACTVSDVTRVRVEREAWRVLSELSGTSGEVFFDLLAKHLVRLFGVTHAMIGKLVQDGCVDSVAFNAEGVRGPLFGYRLKHTPCEQVFVGRRNFVPDLVTDLYPRDTMLTHLNLRSYYGVPLKTPTGRTHGIMVLLSRHPLREEQVPAAVLEAFAARAALELQRGDDIQALRRSEARWQLLFQQASDFIIITDRDGRVEYINRVAEGRNMEDVIGADGFAMVAEAHREDVIRALREAWDTGKAQSVEFAVPHGEVTRWYQARLSALREGSKTLSVLAICRDTTETRGQQELMTALVEESPLGIAIVQDEVIYANHALAEITGRELPTLMGMAMADAYSLCHPEDLPRVLNSLREAIESNRDCILDRFRLMHRDGTERTVEVIIHRVASSGKPAAMVALLDVTGSESVRQELEVSRQKLQHISRLAPGVLYQYVIHPDGRHEFVFVSPGAEKLLGITEEEMLGNADNSWAQVHEDDVPRVHAELAKAAETLSPFESEFRAWHRNGELRWVRSHALPEAQPDGSLLWTGVFTDVTKRRATESALQDHQHKLASVLANLPGLVYRGRMSPDWPVDFIGGNVESVLGCTAEDLTSGRYSIGDMIRKEDAELIWNTIEAASRSNENFQISYRLLGRDGVERWCWEQGRVIETQEGTPIIEGYVADITEVRKLETQLQQAQRLESIGQLAGGVAHDFNNLLTVILGSAEVALAKHDGKPLVGELLKNIRKAAESGASLTRQLLTFARRQVVDPHILELNAHLREEELLLKRVIGENIHLDFQGSPDPCFIRIDPSQFEQILINLAVNARDAMPDGGTFTLRTEIRTLDKHYHELSPGRYVCFEAADTGHGIEPEHLPRLWEPFFTTKPQGRGTGLGLPTCYGIVRQAGGHIEAESEVGKGALFRVLLPLAQAPRPSQRLPAVAPVGRGSETVLLAEDDPLVRGMAVDALRERGFRVLPAGNGEAALRLAEGHEHEIDIVVTDVVMPKLGGRQLVEAIAGRNPRVAALFVSGYSEDETLKAGTAEGSLNFLAKPFTPEALAGKVRAVIDAATRESA